MGECKICKVPTDADWKDLCKKHFAIEKSKEEPKEPSRVGSEEALIGELADLHQKCFQSIEVIIGHKPTTDGELAMVNTLFIGANRKIYGG